MNIANNKILNAFCICKQGLAWIKDEVIMIEPCEHLIHKKCLRGKTYCPYCKNDISAITTTKSKKNTDESYQKWGDILSVTNFDKMSKITPVKIWYNIPRLLKTIIDIQFSKGYNDGLQICKNVFDMNNIKIKVSGIDKIKNSPKVFISNHTSHMDFLVLFYLLKTGFLTSSVINDNPISKTLLNIIPCLIVDRGSTKSKSNETTVDKMKKHVKKEGSICLFPEGMLTHPDTIVKFRTGAFHIGYPIYPIIIKYKNVIADMKTHSFILKIASNQEEIITVKILDPVYPPFSDTDIENVRYKMAKKGKLIMSRVSNKDIKDK
jgi:1-acyl-sn-glycerol-3-phosphate acyltransferase